MADPTINTTAGQTVARELMVLFLNTGTSSAPVWSAIGKRVTDSSVEQDWSTNSEQDILGNTYASAKKPILTQNFDPYKIDAGDKALEKLIQLAVVEQNAQALCNQDCLIVHKYLGSATAPFAERYPSSMVIITSIGGEGGGDIEVAVEATFGGERATGTYNVSQGSFTPSA